MTFEVAAANANYCRRRLRIGNSISVTKLVQSVGPPKTSQEIAQEESLISCRLKPSKPLVIETLTTSEAELRQAGVEWLSKIIVRPIANDTQDKTLMIQQLKTMGEKNNAPPHKQRHHLLSFECSLRPLHKLALQQHSLGGNSTESTSGCSSKQPFSSDDEDDDDNNDDDDFKKSFFYDIDIKPPLTNYLLSRKKGFQNASMSLLKPWVLSKLDSKTCIQMMHRMERQNKVAPKKNLHESSAVFMDPAWADFFRDYVPDIPLRLFLNDWDTRPNGTLRVGVLKDTILDLISGSIKLTTLHSEALSDLLMIVSHLNIAQLLMLRTAQRLVRDQCTNEQQRAFVNRIDTIITEMFFDYIINNKPNEQLRRQILKSEADHEKNNRINLPNFLNENTKDNQKSTSSVSSSLSSPSSSSSSYRSSTYSTSSSSGSKDSSSSSSSSSSNSTSLSSDLASNRTCPTFIKLGSHALKKNRKDSSSSSLLSPSCSLSSSSFPSPTSPHLQTYNMQNSNHVSLNLSRDVLQNSQFSKNQQSGLPMNDHKNDSQTPKFLLHHKSSSMRHHHDDDDDDETEKKVVHFCVEKHSSNSTENAQAVSVRFNKPPLPSPLDSNSGSNRKNNMNNDATIVPPLQLSCTKASSPQQSTPKPKIGLTHQILKQKDSTSLTKSKKKERRRRANSFGPVKLPKGRNVRFGAEFLNDEDEDDDLDNKEDNDLFLAANVTLPPIATDPDGARKCLLGKIPSLFHLKQRRAASVTACRALSIIKECQENEKKTEGSIIQDLKTFTWRNRRLSAPNIAPLSRFPPPAQLPQPAAPMPSPIQKNLVNVDPLTKLSPLDRQALGKWCLLVVGSITMVKQSNARQLRTNASWWLVPLRRPPTRCGFKSERSNKLLGIFLQYPSLVAQVQRPLNTRIYSLRLTSPPRGPGMFPESEPAAWTIMGLDSEGDVKQLEPPSWGNVMTELSIVLAERNVT